MDKNNADIVLSNSGGDGAVREFCDLILKIKQECITDTYKYIILLIKYS